MSWPRFCRHRQQNIQSKCYQQSKNTRFLRFVAIHEVWCMHFLSLLSGSLFRQIFKAIAQCLRTFFSEQRISTSFGRKGPSSNTNLSKTQNKCWQPDHILCTSPILFCLPLLSLPLLFPSTLFLTLQTSTVVLPRYSYSIGWQYHGPLRHSIEWLYYIMLCS